jgi:4-amino-4-deoxy-L-arabinose transferase-like glycosyltransferase
MSHPSDRSTEANPALAKSIRLFRLLQSPSFWLVIACVLCLAPFLDKAVHIDDPLFLWAAQQICRDPLDFYGFSVNWYGVSMPMAEVMQNPPLASYYLAAVGSLFGWSEPVLHLAFLLPAIGVVLGTYCLARLLCSRPVLAALATLLAPAFLVSATTLMCDVLQLCFWVWAVTLWEYGLRRRQLLLLPLAGSLAALAALTKYFGVALVPLLLARACLSPTRDLRGWLVILAAALVALAIPIVSLCGYGKLTRSLYGADLFWGAISYARQWGGPQAEPIRMRLIFGLGFVGGGALTVALLLPRLITRWQSIFALAAPLLVTVVGVLNGTGLEHYYRITAPPWSLGLLVQLVIFGSLGLLLLAVTVLELGSRRDAGSVLLALWIGGTFVFTVFCNWTINIRSILPLVPAVAIVAMRRLDSVQGASASADNVRLEVTWREVGPVLAAGAVAFLVAWSDTWWANDVRAMAKELTDRYRPPGDGKVWFQGHWGFQYYCDRYGAKAVDHRHLRLRPGDWLIEPSPNTGVNKVAEPPDEIRQAIRRPGFPWLGLMDPEVGAGFYCHLFGPLPFAFGPTMPYDYRVIRIVESTPPEAEHDP